MAVDEIGEGFLKLIGMQGIHLPLFQAQRYHNKLREAITRTTTDGRLYCIVLPIPSAQAGFVDDGHATVVDFGSTITVVPTILLIDMMVDIAATVG
jgi:hypothetical protein